MPNWEDALKEAYAHAPTQSVIIHTIEMRHPAFVDAEGNLTAVRVCQNKENFTGTLEDDAITAPLNQNQDVEFLSLGFAFNLPAVRENELPRLTLTLDSVSREIVEHLEQAMSDPQPIDVCYRPYLVTYDASGVETTPSPNYPQMSPPLTLQLTKVTVDPHRVTGVCVYEDLLNRVFPNQLYDRGEFPGLYNI